MINPSILHTTPTAALKAHYHTFGCKLNFAETATLTDMFSQRGILAAKRGEQPDIVVINTCSVTETADKKCRQAIRSFHKRWPEAAILVTGCYSQLKPNEVADIDGVTIVAGNDRKDRLVQYLDQWIEDRSRQVHVVKTAELGGFTPACARGERTRYFLKVQDGCDYYCTYCTIPAARGRSRSATIASLVEQAQRAADAGAREIVLTGVNIGDFGKRTVMPDGSMRKGVETFAQLVQALDGVPGISRYRISSLEPDLLTDEVLEFCAASRAFMPHFHIPLQSGSDSVLRLMHRHYDTELFAHKILRIKQLMPHAFIGVDIIAGARGETPEEFERSLAFIHSLPVTRLHVFPYSERPGTKALDIDHVVTPEEKTRRVAALMSLSDKKMHDFAQQYIGTERPVLLEHSRPGSPMSGFTDNYLKVLVEAPAEFDNRIVPVRLNELVAATAGEWHAKGDVVSQKP